MLFADDELLVVDSNQNQGAYWVDGYAAAGSISYQGAGGGSYQLGATPLVDVAGIDTADGPGMVVATQGRSSVTITGAVIPTATIDVGLVPVAVAGGDVDGDEQDEVIALAADGNIAVCNLDGSCDHWTFDNVTGVDLAAADTDGDGLAEVTLLFTDRNDKGEAVVWNVDDNSALAAGFDTTFKAIAAGDVDHDGRAEIALLEDGGWLGLASDRVNLYRVGSQWNGLAETDVSRHSLDLAAGGVDGSDSGDAMVVLGSDQSVNVLRWNGQALASAYTGSVSTTGSPKRIALGDTDGDSVAARLVEGPQLVPGHLAPMMAVTFPPYDATVSGDEVSGVGVGNRAEGSTDATTTVGLSAGIEVGVGADFLGVFSAKLSTKLSTDVSHSRTQHDGYVVGSAFSLKPQVELYGDRYGAVMVGCTCFHTYTYELVDPANHDGGTGHQMTLIVPVGGQTTVLSTPRYNALAQQLDYLPEISIPSRIGDPASYPTSPTHLDGSPVQPDEMVFPGYPTLAVSDVSRAGFFLLAAHDETNEAAMTTSVSVSGSLGALGVTVGGDLGASWGKSFAVTVGASAEFSGEVPPIADVPSTPEDEYQTHGYSYAPYVYREPYTDPATGQPSGFYVLNYAVSKR
jgi:hypothetical protein